MLLTEKYEVSQADYNRMLNDQKYKDEFIGWRAHFSPYPPAGYGLMNPEILAESGRYYCTWQRRDNCD